jgi:hypothetical protein
MNPREVIDEKKIYFAAKRRKERQRMKNARIRRKWFGEKSPLGMAVPGWAGDDRRGLLEVVSAHAEMPEIPECACTQIM